MPCQALTVVDNFHLRRSDGQTAASRFFGCEHANLFESLVANVRIPDRPKKQNYDLKINQENEEEQFELEEGRLYG